MNLDMKVIRVIRVYVVSRLAFGRYVSLMNEKLVVNPFWFVQLVDF